MLTRITRLALCAAVLLLCTGLARAEVTVSITISGDIDELIPILEHLQRSGTDMGGDEASAEALRFHILSESNGDEAAAATEEESAPKTLSLRAPSVAPASPAAGSTAVVSVTVTDPQRRVDTVGMAIEGTDFSADLLDQGKEGDATAADGIYSRAVTLPEDLAAGEHTVVITGYDRNGAPIKVTGEDGIVTTLTAKAIITVP